MSDTTINFKEFFSRSMVMFVFGFTIGIIIEKIGNYVERYNVLLGLSTQLFLTSVALYGLYFYNSCLALELQSSLAGLFFVSSLFNTQSYFTDLTKYF